MISTELN